MMGYVSIRDMSIEQLERRGWGTGSAGDLAAFECRAMYHRKKAAESGFIMRTYHNSAAGVYEFWNGLSF